MLKVDEVHLELTNICVLKCPRCSRTKFINDYGKHWETASLKLDQIVKFLDVPLLGMEVLLCGNYGDPIYNKDLFDVVRWLKSQGAIVRLLTNGSYKTVEWWRELVGLLTPADTIEFSVDGTPANFTAYRINADWDSISAGMKVVGESVVNSTWSYIPFKYCADEASISEARRICREVGIKEFVLNPSDRWDSENDIYKPISFYGRRESAHKQLRMGNKIELAPQCASGRMHFISAQGFYSPCCYTSDHRFYYKTVYGKCRELFNINEKTLTEILGLQEHKEFINSISGDNAPAVCMHNCPKDL